MEYIYSALLLHAAGKEIGEESISKVLKAAGVNVDASRVKALAATLEDVDIDDALAQAIAMPSAAPAAGAAAPAHAAGAAAEKAEEKEEEVSEEEAAAGLGALFG
ncbi:MAG: 50S ribosomal protein P1 [Thermoplasmata archaeon]|nr:50S ribosomal protein P1 [Thermoplasmata archaeon]